MVLYNDDKYINKVLSDAGISEFLWEDIKEGKEEVRSILSIEQADNIYQRLNDNRVKSSLLLFCSDDLKIKEINNYIGSGLDLVASFNDDLKRLEALQLLLEGKKINPYSMVSCLKSFDQAMWASLIDVICDYSRANADFEIDLLFILDVISIYNEEFQEKVLDKLLGFLDETYDNGVISDSYVEDLINVFPMDKKLKVVNKFFELSKKGKFKFNVYFPSKFLNDLDDDIKLEFVKLCLENDLLLNKWFIPNVFENLSDDLKDEALKLFYEYENKIMENLIDDEIIAGILETYSPEHRMEKFNQLVIKDRGFIDFLVIKYFKDDNIRFEALGEKVKNMILMLGEENKAVILEHLNDWFNEYNGKFPEGEIIVPDLIDFYTEMFSLKKENFIEFVQRFGYVSLIYLGIKSIRDIINLEEKYFHDFMALFKKENVFFDNDTLNTVINAILQREFIYQCNYDYNIFNYTRNLIEDKKFAEVEEVLLNISSVVNINEILSQNNISMDVFISELLSGNQEMLSILHKITEPYIVKKKENYLNERLANIYDELDLNKKYEKNFIKKKYLATNSISKIKYEICQAIDNINLTKEHLEFKQNKNLLDDIIKFKKSPREYQLNSNHKKYLKPFEELLNILYEDDKLEDPTNDVNAKYVYFPKEISNEYLLSVFCELDMANVEKFLLRDSNLMDRLAEILSKYKLLSWNNTFSSLEQSADLEFSSDTLGGIINHFYEILPRVSSLGNNKINLTSLIGYGNCYASTSFKYRLLFGNEVNGLLSVGASGAQSKKVKHERLELAVQHLVGMYNKDAVSVPTLDIDLELSNGKVVNAMVGNTTNMRNLVLGELTDACMRIGGAFYDLYKECVEGKVGFNIMFVEPGTEKFISRVSGLRNGNTLFLNELRYSEYDKYTNEDCVEALRIVARELIEQSRDSEYPIDNVVVTADYSMAPHADELQKLYLPNRNAALYNISHNLNTKGTAIVLASSSLENKLVPIKLGKDKISYYEPQRDKVRIYEGKDATNRVCQLQALVNGILNKKHLAAIDVFLNKDIVKCISGSDWFISIDNQDNVMQFILDGVDKSKALEEMALYLEQLNKNSSLVREGVLKR